MERWVLDRRRFFPVAQKCGQEALAASSQRLMAEAHFPCRYAAQLVMEVEVEVVGKISTLSMLLIILAEVEAEVEVMEIIPLVVMAVMA